MAVVTSDDVGKGPNPAGSILLQGPFFKLGVPLDCELDVPVFAPFDINNFSASSVSRAARLMKYELGGRLSTGWFIT